MTDVDDYNWVYEDEHGWLRQHRPWGGDRLFLVFDENHHLPGTPVHHGLNHGYGLGILRRGAYRRGVRGGEQVVDANTGFLRFDGDEVDIDYFTGEPCAMTFVGVDPAVVGGWFDSPVNDPAFTVTPQLELAHLRLVNAQRGGADDLSLEWLTLAMLSAAVAQHRARIREYSRRTTGQARRTLVAEACELLHVEKRISLLELARTIGCSPFHLSRVFREITGMTIPQYRNRLRVHEALRMLDDGHTDLAAVAAASGFADHSHMTRSMVGHFGAPPSRLRKLLDAGGDVISAVTTTD